MRGFWVGIHSHTSGVVMVGWMVVALFMGGLSFSEANSPSGPFVVVRHQPRYLQKNEHQELLKLLQQRGWKVLPTRSVSSRDIRVSFRSRQLVVIQQQQHSRTFEIPAQYQAVTTRVRAVAAFLELFLELEAPPGWATTTVTTPQHSNATEHPVSAMRVESVRSDGVKKPDPLNPDQPATASTGSSHSPSKQKLQEHRHSQPRQPSKTSRSRLSNKTPRAHRVSRSRNKAMGRRKVALVQTKNLSAKAEMEQATSSSKRRPVAAKATGISRKSNISVTSVQRTVPARKTQTVAQLRPKSEDVRSIHTPKPNPEQNRSWFGEVGAGVSVGFQGVPGVPLGGWFFFKGGWQRLFLRIDVQLAGPVGAGDLTLVQAKPGMSFGYHFSLRNIRIVPMIGFTTEILSFSYAQQNALNVRWGGVLAAEVHIPVATHWWFVSSLSWTFFPQPYQFYWQSNALYEARAWLVALSFGVQFRVF